MAQIYNEMQLSSYVDQIFERVRLIEAQLALISEKLGVVYDSPASMAPPEVVELARAGKRGEALKRYRELTGASLQQAQEVLAHI